MTFKIVSIISLLCTILLVIVIVMPIDGCTQAQMEKTASIAHSAAIIAPIVAPLIPAITWPVWSVLGIDIVSSILAAIVAFRQKKS